MKTLLVDLRGFRRTPKSHQRGMHHMKSLLQCFRHIQSLFENLSYLENKLLPKKYRQRIISKEISAKNYLNVLTIEIKYKGYSGLFICTKH